MAEKQPKWASDRPGLGLSRAFCGNDVHLTWIKSTSAWTIGWTWRCQLLDAGLSNHISQPENQTCRKGRFLPGRNTVLSLA